MPTSKEMRVRVEGFSKIRASTLPVERRLSAAPRGAPFLARRPRSSRAALRGRCRTKSRKWRMPFALIRPIPACASSPAPRRSGRRRARCARPPRRSSSSSMFSGGRSRTTLSPAATVIIFSARSASTNSPPAHGAQAEQQSVAAHFGDDSRMRSWIAASFCLSTSDGAAHALEEAVGEHHVEHAHRPPPWRADCRHRSSRGCRRSCPWRPRRWRGSRRAGSRRRAPWRPP